MKNILFILSLIIWCSCSNEILFDIDKVGDIVTVSFKQKQYLQPGQYLLSLG